jgi:hypothetical protein
VSNPAVNIIVSTGQDRDKYTTLEIRLADARRTPAFKLRVATRELRAALEPQRNTFSTISAELVP